MHNNIVETVCAVTLTRKTTAQLYKPLRSNRKRSRGRQLFRRYTDPAIDPTSFL